MEYIQAPHLSEREIELLLQSAKVARLCSYNRDGTIHAIPVWYKYENNRIVVGTPVKSRKAVNLKRNSNVTVLIDVDGPPTRGVIVYGRADVKDLDTIDMINESISIFQKYMSEKEAKVYAEGLSKITKWAKITIKPLKFASFDFSKDELYMRATQGFL